MQMKTNLTLYSIVYIRGRSLELFLNLLKTSVTVAGKYLL